MDMENGDIPNFFVADVDELFGLDKLEVSEDEISDAPFVNDNDGNVSSSRDTDAANQEMERAMQIPNVPTLSINQESAQASRKRFKFATDQDIMNYQNSRQSKSTRKNTKWGYKTFQDWSLEALGRETDLERISAAELDPLLCRFYAEATPRSSEKRVQELSAEKAAEYHKNTMKNIRSALNRHLKDIGRDFDIVRDKEFRPSNNTLDGKLKFNLRNGLSRATKHKEIISPADLIKISTYLYSELNPTILRQRVWYDISMNFMTRGLEFHQQLSPRSFVFANDENGTEYVELSHETVEKNWQGGLDDNENPANKRMYACIYSDRCPVASLKFFLSKTDSNSQHLFNHCTKQALESPETEHIWYTCEPIKYHQFTQFMSDISRKSGCSTRYTAHCIRATAIQALNDMGFELRHIMYFSGHRSESAIRSYNRECTAQQKKSISNTLSSISSGNISNSTALVPVSNQTSVTRPTCTTASPINESRNLPISWNNSNTLSTGLISNSSFSNCVFNFGGQT